MSEPPPRRPARRPPRRRMPVALALVLALATLLAGILVGYAARGDAPPGGLVTEQRELPVVTVTVPE